MTQKVCKRKIVATIAISALLISSLFIVLQTVFAATTLPGYTAVPDRDTSTVVGVSPTHLGRGQQVIIYIMTYPAPAGPTFYAQDVANELTGGLRNIEIRYIYGYIYSDLMPPIAEDPIQCGLVFELRNLSEIETMDSLKIEKCQVFLSNNMLLGEIKMKLQNEINLEPISTDTVWFYKIHEEHTLFESPCEKEVFLLLNIRDKYNNFIKIRTNKLYYWCLY